MSMTPHSPATMPVARPPKAPSAKNLIPLYRTVSELPLLVASNCPFSLCNYRCHYCYLDHDNPPPKKKADTEFSQWLAVMGRVIEIPRPLYLAIGTVGEPMASRKFWDTLRALSPLDHVRGFWFPTNLSRPLEKMARGVDPKKLGLTGSFHPSEFRNFDRDFDFFIRQCAWLLDRGGDVYVNFILSPDQIDKWHTYQARFAKHGIQMTANVFKGKHQGKTYPEAYTPEQLEIIRDIFKTRPYIFKYMSGTSSRGVSCTAGRDFIKVEPDGTVLNCQFARVKMGNIFDDDLMVYSNVRPCTTNWCECHWNIGFMEENVRRFRRTRSIFRYEERPAGEIGEQAFV